MRVLPLCDFKKRETICASPVRFSGSFLKSVSLLGLMYHLWVPLTSDAHHFKPSFLSLPNNFYIKEPFYDCLFLNCRFDSLSHYSSHYDPNSLNILMFTLLNSFSMFPSSWRPCLLLFLYTNLNFPSRSW